MRRLNVYRLALLSLALGCFTQVFSQNTVVVQTRHVEWADVGEFVHRETTYWREVARRAVEEGKLTSWELWQRVDGFDLHEDHNFLFVNVYTPDQFRMEGNIWDFRKVFPDKKMSEIGTFQMSAVQDVLYFRNLHHVEKSPPQFLRVNMSYASNLRAYAQMETDIWGPFISEKMEAGETNVVSWGFSRLVLPRGRNVPYNAVSVDGFSTLADALTVGGSNFSEGTEYPEDLSKLRELHEKVEVHVYRLVGSTWSNEE